MSLFTSFACAPTACFCFSFSPNMLEMKKLIRDYKMNKTSFWLAVISDDNALG